MKISSERLRRKEIKKILLGKLVPTGDGRLTAGGVTWVTPWGFSDGSISVIAFGIGRKRIRYKSVLKNNKQVLFQAGKAVKNIGNSLYIQTSPDAVACYIRGGVFRPTVLLLEEQKNKDKGQNEFVLSVYSGRALFAFLARNRALKSFEKCMEGKLVRKNAPDQE
ncbi:MAG: hypothetical protein IJ696_03310 [Ruminococcus sp.]|nr:hypothetical protein [Ruminococcus sp.]